ncbi:Eukaryotic translation initiation factor 3 subunit F [Wickerhamiella sorbophila]|uniref:Eukaryotic translation initiation factor 3 subunit F n=1 Tax=Wickerhamiella sorbophila TaxID=45607 RepID=A0A2T0FPE6_9ASCO|nr:Eukaryotic translation initiation factor 3 subunit F [Wickerhamiella sorbophila]PRT56848.1 Eukaryotic translation initiation factor 3 subunit F [Wickerhamiella sorbophila]
MTTLQTARPPVQTGRQAVQYPTKVTIDARALFQIMSHALRRKPDQPRVIGTLVGTRSDDGNEVEVKSAYIVPIDESEDQVDINIEYHKEMFQLVRRVNPESVILGWYATSTKLDNLSALIHDFYSQEHGTYPHPAVYVTVPTTEVSDIEVRSFISSPIRLPGDVGLGNCIFLPIQNEVVYTDTDNSAMTVVNKAASSRMRNAEVFSDIANLDQTIAELIESIDKVQTYVRKVLNGKSEASVAVGKYLYRTLTLLPMLSNLTIEELYESYLENVLAVVHLTQAVKTQLELTSELTPLV